MLTSRVIARSEQLKDPKTAEGPRQGRHIRRGIHRQADAGECRNTQCIDSGERGQDGYAPKQMRGLSVSGLA